MSSFPRAVQTEIYTDKRFSWSTSITFECRQLSAAGENFEVYETDLDEMLVNLQHKAVDFRAYLCENSLSVDLQKKENSLSVDFFP